MGRVEDGIRIPWFTLVGGEEMQYLESFDRQRRVWIPTTHDHGA